MTNYILKKLPSYCAHDRLCQNENNTVRLLYSELGPLLLVKSVIDKLVNFTKISYNYAEFVSGLKLF